MQNINLHMDFLIYQVIVVLPDAPPPEAECDDDTLIHVPPRFEMLAVVALSSLLHCKKSNNFLFGSSEELTYLLPQF